MSLNIYVNVNLFVDCPNVFSEKNIESNVVNKKSGARKHRLLFAYLRLILYREPTTAAVPVHTASPPWQTGAAHAAGADSVPYAAFHACARHWPATSGNATIPARHAGTRRA